MSRLVLPAFAKINLGLQIVRKRPDGYHEIRTTLQTISLCDTLEFEPAARLSLTVDDPRLPVDEENLVIRAARSFARAARRPSRFRIRLVKKIPAGAGLGGGSSDAAVTLLALNRLHGCPLPAASLRDLASGLGSDVAFFLTGGTALALGRGEIICPVRDLEPRWVVVVTPDVRISTADAYRRVDGLTRRQGKTSIYRFSRQQVRTIRSTEQLANDLERAVAPIHSALRGMLGLLRTAGAGAPAMTGSGSAVYGLFAGEGEARRALRYLTGRSVAQAWLGRTVGTAEYSARVRF